jgi:hypothetical protein
LRLPFSLKIAAVGFFQIGVLPRAAVFDISSVYTKIMIAKPLYLMYIISQIKTK